MGIAPENQERVFQDFQRVAQADGHRRQGTGPGLPLSRELAELHHGRLWLTGQVGVGSSFTLALPLRQPDTSPDGSELSGSPGSGVIRSGRVINSINQVNNNNGTTHSRTSSPILVVDDDPRSISLIGALLQPEGYTVITAANGAVGLELMGSAHPGLVILDLGMPVLDGYGVIERVRADSTLRQVPIILLTGESLDAQAQARLDGNVSHILQKGDWDQSDFLALVRTHYRPSRE